MKTFKIVLVTESKDWRQLIIDCLNNMLHTEDEASTTRMTARARSYTLIDGILYKKGVVQPLLKFIPQSEGKKSAAGNPLRFMRLTHWSEGTIYEGHQTRILLAYAHQRHI